METRHEEYHSGEILSPCIPFLHIRRRADLPPQSTNWHENLEIQLCVQGEGFVQLDGEKWPFTVGDIVVVNANQVHYTGTDTSLVYHCLILDNTFCRAANVPCQPLWFDTRFRSEVISQCFEEVIALQDAKDDPCCILKQQMAIARLLVELREHHVAAHKPQKGTKPMFDDVKNVIRYIREHYAESITLDQLSRHILCDKYAMCKSFKQLTGQTVVGYLNVYRCEKAKGLLADGKTVSEAALLCGFHNMSFFTKTFKEKMGKLPSSYKTGANY